MCVCVLFSYGTAIELVHFSIQHVGNNDGNNCFFTEESLCVLINVPTVFSAQWGNFMPK